MKKQVFILCLILIGCGKNDSQNQKGYQTENVILITLDGVRWEDVFYGADQGITNDTLFVKDVEKTSGEFWNDDYQVRRKTVFPFLWGTVGVNGQLYGNKQKGSIMHLTNPNWFSYPGYSELLVGFNDDSVNSNAKEWNPNINVLEFLDNQVAFKNKVAAFASWDVFDWIINKDRNTFTINSGGFPFVDSLLTPKQQWLNAFISDVPTQWNTSVRWDAFTFEYAFEYLRLNKPRVLYIAFDETDEYAHEGQYDKYLISARKIDGYIEQIWQWVQSHNQYKNKTTLIISTDHGRGVHKGGTWRSHGDEYPGAEFTWSAIMGPDTPGLGEMTNTDTITTSQIAATFTHLLGYDYESNRPVGSVIKGMIK
jgi:hypothetical protein